MAAVLCLLFAGEISVDDVINWVKCDPNKTFSLLNQSSEITCQGFVPFFLNYLRDQSSAILQESQAAACLSTPSKALSLLSKSVEKAPRKTSTPASAESLRTSNYANRSVVSPDLSASGTVNSKKRWGDHQLCTTFSPSPTDLRIPGEWQKSLKGRFDSGGTNKPRCQRSANLGDFIISPGSGDGLGRALFHDVQPVSHAKRSHGKSKVSSNRQTERNSSPSSAVTKFDLGSSADFPDVAQKDSSTASKAPSRRIQPTMVPNVDTNSLFTQVPIVPAPAHAMPRSVWAQPRKINSVSSESPASNAHVVTNVVNEREREPCHSPHQTSISTITPKKPIMSRLVSCDIVSASPLLVTSSAELTLLAQLYSRCILESLVPNVMMELYFIVQLICARTAVSPEATGDVVKQDLYLDNVHNCVYFATRVLQLLHKLFLLLDQHTVQLLANHQRLTDFIPELKQILKPTVESSAQIIPLYTPPPLGGVMFQADTDNRTNFPNDQSFQLFKKQRDVFYELLREWEEKHVDPGWTVIAFQSDRIRQLIRCGGSDLTYILHLVRLFLLQLLQMCSADGRKVQANGEDPLNQSELKHLNPDKLKRLQERLIAPSNTRGICPSPSFPSSQEFFRDFIVSASSDTFNRHLRDCIVAKILELSTSVQLPKAEESDQDENSDLSDLHGELINCFVTLRILGKFLGFVTFLPYQTREPPVESVALVSLASRNEMRASFDVYKQLILSLEQHRLAFCIVWLVDYLSMIDTLGTRLDYYRRVFVLLIFIYRYCCKMLSKQQSHLVLLIVVLLGWLFELHVYFDGLFFQESDPDFSTESQWNSHLNDVEKSSLVNQKVLYACCPNLVELRNVLIDFEMGVRNQGASLRKITPTAAIMTPPPPAAALAPVIASDKQIQMQLEESFFRLHSASLQRTTDFVAERVASNWIKTFQSSQLVVLVQSWKNEVKVMLMNVDTTEMSDVTKAVYVTKLDKMANELLASVLHDCQTDCNRYCKQKCSNLIPQILSDETTHQVLTTAIHITARKATEKITIWLVKNFTLSFIMKNLKTEFDKLIRLSSTHSNTGENASADEIVPNTPSQCANHNSDLPNPSDIIYQLKDVHRRLLLHTGHVDDSLLSSAVSCADRVLGERQDLVPAAATTIASLVYNIAIAAISSQPNLWSDSLQAQSIKVWKSTNSAELLKNIISVRSVTYLEQSSDIQASWAKFTSLLVGVLSSRLLSTADLWNWCQFASAPRHNVKENSRLQLARCLQAVASSCRTILQPPLSDLTRNQAEIDGPRLSADESLASGSKNSDVNCNSGLLCAISGFQNEVDGVAVSNALTTE